LTVEEVQMARRSPQTLGKRLREQAKREKRERKQQKRAAAAAARSGEPPASATNPESEQATLEASDWVQ
jgi:hypothetical protein